MFCTYLAVALEAVRLPICRIWKVSRSLLSTSTLSILWLNSHSLNASEITHTLSNHRMESTSASQTARNARLTAIRNGSRSFLLGEIACLPQDRLPQDYIDGLQPGQQELAFKFCLLAWEVTAGSEIPRRNQLEAAMIMYARCQDVLVIAGTGSGKTLIIVLLILMEDEASLVVTLSPLKRLQITQVRYPIGPRHEEV